MTRSNWIGTVVGIGIVLAAAVSASAHDRGLTCVNQCRANLKENGLWNAYPYGYCRNKCGQMGSSRKISAPLRMSGAGIISSSHRSHKADRQRQLHVAIPAFISIHEAL
jgi:hypothetical protein